MFLEERMGRLIRTWLGRAFWLALAVFMLVHGIKGFTGAYPYTIQSVGLVMLVWIVVVLVFVVSKYGHRVVGPQALRERSRGFLCGALKSIAQDVAGEASVVAYYTSPDMWAPWYVTGPPMLLALLWMPLGMLLKRTGKGTRATTTWPLASPDPRRGHLH